MSISKSYDENNLLINLRRLSKAKRAIAYLLVEWSGPERLNRNLFNKACEMIAAREDALQIYVAILNDDSPLVEAWLRGLHLSDLHTRGSGAVIWLTHGEVLGYEVNIGNLSPEGIVTKTIDLFRSAI